MKVLANRKGIDLNFARKQRWWAGLSRIIETDDETMRILVSYMFEEVSRGKVNELEWVNSLFVKGENIVNAQVDMVTRIEIIKGYVKNPPKENQ